MSTPNDPIIAFIRGDGIGMDITPVMMKVVDSAVEKAYGGDKKINWMEAKNFNREYIRRSSQILDR